LLDIFDFFNKIGKNKYLIYIFIILYISKNIKKIKKNINKIWLSSTNAWMFSSYEDNVTSTREPCRGHSWCWYIL